MRTARILAALAAGGPVTGWPRALVESCRDSTAVSGVGLALMSADGLGGVLAATDGLAQRMEDLQFVLGEGPCREAARSGDPVLVPDLGGAPPSEWPSFAAAAVDGGVCAAFAFPLQVGSTTIGVLDLYREARGALTPGQRAAAVAYAEAATAVLLHMQDHADPAAFGDVDGDGGPGVPGGSDVSGRADLTEVLERRAVVMQAAGMVSVQLETSPELALVRLRAHAYSAERPILDVAADVVARRLRFDDSDAGTSTTCWTPPHDADPTEEDSHD